MRKRSSVVLLIALLSAFAAFGQGNSNGHGKGNGKGNGHAQQAGDSDASSSSKYVFSGSDRIRIENCMSDTRSLPPGLAKRQQLPPGLQKHIQKNGQLPPGLQKKVQPLPSSCEARLPRLPDNVTRVVLGNYVILKDIKDRILDLIELDRR